jgi:hypothetical protein
VAGGGVAGDGQQGREGRTRGPAATSGGWRAPASRRPGRAATGDQRSQAGAGESAGVGRLPVAVATKKKTNNKFDTVRACMGARVSAQTTCRMK